MEKIKSSDNQFFFFRSSKKKKQNRLKTGKSSFSKTVESIFENRPVIDDQYSDENIRTLDKMLDEVCGAGEKLKQAPTFENIKVYKRTVKHFLKYIVEHMVNLEEHISGINILKKKRFTIINIVDQKLESLAVEIIGNQNQQINILSRIDEINGLLVDILR